MSTPRPAGMSDEEESDDGLSFRFTANNKPHSSRTPPQPTFNAQPAGRLNSGDGLMEGASGTGSSLGKHLNAKQRRSAKFWEQKRAIDREQQNLPAVVDPKSNPKTSDFFRFAKQANMDLRMDLKRPEVFGIKNPEHVSNIQKWKLEEVEELGSPEGVLRQLPFHILLSSPIANYRGKPIYFIDATNFDAMIELIDSSAKPNELSIDLECNTSHSFLGMVALLQVAVREVAFLVDPFSCFMQIKNVLQPRIEDPKVLKIMFGMGNDVKQFQKDFGILPLGIVDLQQLYNTTRSGNDLVGLTTVCQKLLPDYNLVKSCTLADWRRRPLTLDMSVYAASDVIVLFDLWDKLKSILNDQQMFYGVESSKTLLKNAFKLKTYATALEELKKKNLSVGGLSQEEYNRFLLLHQWRERYAAICDEVPAAIASTDCLFKLSKLTPPVADGVMKKIGIPEATLRAQKHTLLIILRDAGSDLFMRINNCECHNCLLIGHAAVHCPFPPNKNRQKLYGATHPEYKTQQNRRRNQNKIRNRRAREAAAAINP